MTGNGQTLCFWPLPGSEASRPTSVRQIIVANSKFEQGIFQESIGETFTNKTGFSSFIPLFVIGLIFTATGLIINSVQEEY